METSPEQHNRRPPPDENAETISRYKGIRLRKWGKWVSEVRMPKSREKIWLGSYDTAEKAARAYDAAVFCLRGPNAQFNFPDCIPHIPCASSLSPEQIQVAANKYALDHTPSANNLDDALREEPPSPSLPAPLSESEPSNHPGEQGEHATLGNLFGDSDGNPYSTLERLPSLDSATLDFSLAPEAEEPGYIYFDASDLWKM